MLNWIGANLGTILIALALAAVVAAIVAGMVRDRRKGKGACSCGCESCGACHACTHNTNAS